MMKLTKSFMAVGLVLASAGSVPAAEFGTKVLDATYKLFHPSSTSTCFVVRDGADDAVLYLVTTAHTLERTRGETATIVLRERNDQGLLKRRDFAVPIRNEEKPLWSRHKDHDVAVLALPDEIPVDIRALPLDWLADEQQLNAADLSVCDQLFVLTYPERFEATAAGLPVARQGIFASPPMLPAKQHPTFLADYTTFAGDSGGPVFIASDDRSRPLVVGVVLAQYNHDEKIETKFERRLVRHPLGLGIVLHAQYVRETIALATSQM